MKAFAKSDKTYDEVMKFMGADAVKTWCKENGFEFIECVGDGYDDGYEPDIMRGGYW